MKTAKTEKVFSDAPIDRIFRKFGERDFGKDLMDTISSKQLEEFRCGAFRCLHEMTRQFGRQEDGTLEALFYFILLEHFKK